MEALGLFRFMLATTVVAGHLGVPFIIDAHRHAVIAFFCISGYLITRINILAYKGRPAAFLVNRLLRIYPMYYAAISIGLSVVLISPDVAKSLNGALSLPQSLIDWAHQFFIFGLRGSAIRLSPPTWSLNTELYFYLIIGLVTHKSKNFTFLVLILSLIIGAVALLYPSNSFTDGFYGSPIGNAFCFYLGSASYFASTNMYKSKHRTILMSIILIASAFLMPYVSEDKQYRDFLLFVTSFSVSGILLSIDDVNLKLAALKPISIFLGRLSYPIFLIHWSVSVWIFSIIKTKGFMLFFFGYIVTLIVSIILVILIDYPLEKRRESIRGFKIFLNNKT